MRIVPTSEREGGELEPRGPTLGALLETREIHGVEIEAERLGEQGTRLIVGEAEVRAAHLHELPPHAQPPDRQRRLSPGGDRDLHRVR